MIHTIFRAGTRLVALFGAVIITACATQPTALPVPSALPPSPTISVTTPAAATAPPTTSSTLAATITATSLPQPPATETAGTSVTLLVSNAAGRSVSFVDPQRGVLAQVAVGAAPWGIALGTDGRAFVTTAEGVAVVDTAARTRLALVPYTTDMGQPQFGEYRSGGMGIALSPDERFAYVGLYLPDGTGRLDVLDTTSLQFIGSAPTGYRPFQVVVSQDGREAYVLDHDTFTVTAVDTTSLNTRKIDVAPLGTAAFDKPHYAAQRPDGRLLMPVQGKVLMDLDPASGQFITSPLTANTHQHGVALGPDGQTLLIVGTGAAGSATSDASLSIVNLATGDERVVPLSRPHEWVAASPDGREAYLTGGYTFANGGWDGLTIVDLQTLVTRELPVPDRPQDIVVLP